MRVQLERAGGFHPPAMRRAFAVDSESLPPAEARELAELVSSAGLPELAASSSPPTARPDMQYYRLTLQDESGSKTVVLAERDVPDRVRPLLDWLRRHERKP
jgi:hypothetical protein